MRVLIGGPVADIDSPVYRASRKCAINQKTVYGSHLRVEPFYLEDKGEDKRGDGDIHRWPNESIERVARLRQRFLEEFLRSDHDFAMMVDTDVLMGPHVVQQMIRKLQYYKADVAYGVFWTDFGLGPQPQVWLHHPYDRPGWPGVDHMYRRLEAGDTILVNGGGACTLFTRNAAEKGQYHPRVPGMPPDGTMWIGEDRSFALTMCVHDCQQIAVGGLPILHQYKPVMRTPEALKTAMEAIGQ